ncbi:MAG TPA: tetratricopeptide repeat protein [Vicinamibacteria bacterium]
MKCSRCGHENPAGRVECAACAAPLLDPSGETAVTELPGQESKTVVPPPTVRGGGTPTEIRPDERTGSVYMPSSPSGRSAPASSTGSSTLSTGELVLGTVFGGRYEIVSILGQGGMGRVYKARDRELDKLIALKTIRLDTAEGIEALQRFKQELLLARKVTHKNVVRIFDLGEADGIKFFTMEYIEGDSLKTVIRRKGRIPPAEAAALSRQILSALDEAHAQGIVHRDLKPQNVMVDGQGHAHLMDFGIARATDTTGMTATGAVVGTPDYMSPEQVKGEKAGPASDMFSFGVILYEMLTGELPYQAETPMSKVMMRLSHKPRPVRQISTDVPKYLEGVVRKCLEIDPELRYPRASGALADIDREAASSSFTVRLRHVARRRRGWIAAAALLAVAAASAAWRLALRPTPEPPAAAVAAGPVRTLAILPLTNATGSQDLEWLRQGLPDMLVTDLSQSRFVRPIPGDRVLSVLHDLGAVDQTRFDEAALESVSSRAPAESVLHGQFVESGGRLRVDLTLRRAGTGVPIPIKAEGTTAEVFVLVDRIATEVKANLDLTEAQIKGDSVRPFTDVATSSVDALRAYQSGLAPLRERSFQAAIPLFRETVGHDPDFAMAWARLGEAYLGAGEQREAEAAIDRARSLSEKSPLPTAQRFHVHALAALVKDDLATAATSYRELAKLYPDDPDVQFRLATALRELGDQPAAIEAFKRVLKLSPGYGAAEIDLAGVYWSAGRHDDAIATLRAALAASRFGDDPEALGTVHSILGVAYRDSGRLEESLPELERSLAYREKAGDKRGQATTLTNLASVYEFQGQIGRALGAERRALAIAREMRDRGRESYILNNMGLTYREAGQLDRALAAFRESMSIEMERQDHDELANRLDKIADVYREMDRYDDALVYLEQAKSHLEKTETKEEKAVNLHYLGQVRIAQGAYEQALEALLAALPILQEINQQIGVAGVHRDLAFVYEQQGRYADAWSSLQQSLDLYQKLHSDHSIAELRGPRGRLLATLGRFDEADKELADGDHVGGHGHGGPIEMGVLLARAEVLRGRGKLAEAAALLEEAEASARREGARIPGIEARIELGRLRRAQGRAAEAATLLTRARAEAAKARVRGLETRAAAGLASAQAARGRAEEARRSALDAISVAEKYQGRPVLVEARAALGRALDRLGRDAEATDAWARTAADLDWIRGSLKPEHVDAFMTRRDVQALLGESLARLDKAGRASEAAALRPFLSVPAKRAGA